MEVTLLNRQRGHRVDCRKLSDFIDRLTGEIPSAKVDSVAVCLVSDRKMREYNRMFRGRSKTTDVLSFPAGKTTAPEAPRHLGDIVISVQTAAERAVRLRHSLDRELKVLTLHGYLHLLGYDHETDDGRMIRLQDRLIRRLLRPPTGRRRA